MMVILYLTAPQGVSTFTSYSASNGKQRPHDPDFTQLLAVDLWNATFAIAERKIEVGSNGSGTALLSLEL